VAIKTFPQRETIHPMDTAPLQERLTANRHSDAIQERKQSTTNNNQWCKTSEANTGNPAPLAQRLKHSTTEVPCAEMVTGGVPMIGCSFKKLTWQAQTDEYFGVSNVSKSTDDVEVRNLESRSRSGSASNGAERSGILR